MNLRYRLDWIAWGGLLSGVGALLFCIAWAMGAYLEGALRTGKISQERCPITIMNNCPFCGAELVPSKEEADDSPT